MLATAKTSVANKADVDAFWSKLADCKEEGDFDKADDIISAEGKNSAVLNSKSPTTGQFLTEFVLKFEEDPPPGTIH